MRLSQLEYFRKVAELGSVSGAARELHVSQPAITTSIRALEEELGVELFDRVKQRMILTEAGRHFSMGIGKVLDALYAVRDETRAMSDRNHRVNLGIPAMIGLLYTQGILHDFRLRYPEVEVHLTEANTRELRTLMDEGRIDLALMIGESPYSRGLERRVLLRTKYCFFVGEGNPLAGREMIDAATVARQPLILFGEGLFLNWYITDALKSRGLEPKVGFTSSQIIAIKSYVREARAGTFLMRECVSPEDGLVEVPTEITPDISIVATWLRDQRLPPQSIQLLQYLQNYR